MQGHSIRHPTRYQQSLEQREQGLVAWEILLDQDEQEYSPTAQQWFYMQMAMAEPVLFAISSDPDIMYLHEAMCTPDREQFLSAMEQEIKGDGEGKRWALVPKEQVPKGTKVLDAVWFMRCKRCIESREIYKQKCLPLHGGQQFTVKTTGTPKPQSWHGQVFTSSLSLQLSYNGKHGNLIS